MKNLLFFMFVLFSYVLVAQEEADTNLYRIVKFDGVEYIAKILNDDGREVLIETESLGKIYIPKSQIKSIVKIEFVHRIIQGNYIDEGPFTTRYAFTTNALPIRQGENYAMINLYGPEVHFALSDNFNVGLMTTWIGSPIAVAMKRSFTSNNENINFSLGGLFGTSGYINSFKGIGALGFGNITFGDRIKNLTLAGGYLFFDPNLSRKEQFPKEGTFITDEPYYYYYGQNIPTIEIKNNVSKGPMFSLGAYHKIGTKAAFIFDSMLGIFEGSKRYEVNSNEIQPPVGNPWQNDYEPGVYELEVTHFQSGPNFAFFFMPGMRFQSRENRAFQVSIAGVSRFNDFGSNTFPFPMCTWFFQF
jgi:hypothetical protein